MARIIVAGYMVRYPVAGNLFAFFHYLLGLRRLGHDVLYLEVSGWPFSCYDPATMKQSNSPTAGLRIVRALMASYGLNHPVCYVDEESGDMHGMDWQGLKQSMGLADILLNIGGVNWLPELRSCRHRALIDMDPLFTQMGRFGGKHLDEHHVHFSYGMNIGRPGCGIPSGGVKWVPTAPPVVCDVWGYATPREDSALTTIANWSAYDAVWKDGRRFGQKDEQFIELLELPRSTSQQLELALSGIDAITRKRLQTAGWSVRDAVKISADVSDYQEYIRHSRGEFSVAKHAYVATKSGWFSDRSVCYLAAGLPVVLQDTGFSDWLPESRGVLAFATVEEAVACLDRLNLDYPARRQAARETAEQVFDHRVVLPRLIDKTLGRDAA